VVSCAPTGKYTDGADLLKKEINTAAGPALLNLTAWQYQNFTRPDRGNKIYGLQIIDQDLLREQLEQVLIDNNIHVIPAVRFRLERPPYLLVISPRSKIEYFDRVLLSADIDSEDIAGIESKVDNLNFASLVIGLGGLGAAYPAIVSPEMSTRQIINTAVEEWAHQFLALRPLGALYLLDCVGLRQPPEIIVMNESVAGMIAEEIGAQVYDRYYKQAVQPVKKTDDRIIDFTAEMRETRRNVDMLLRAGEIGAAEQYMESRRVYFEQNGYSIRKLNQAYFAFHGIYGDDPGAVSPVYAELIRMRKGYTTLAGFINDVSAMTCYSQLKEAIPD